MGKELCRGPIPRVLSRCTKYMSPIYWREMSYSLWLRPKMKMSFSGMAQFLLPKVAADEETGERESLTFRSQLFQQRKFMIFLPLW